MMNDKTKLSQADSQLFRQAVQDVTPLPQSNKVELKPLKKLRRKRQQSFDNGSSHTLDSTMGHGQQDILGPNDILCFARSGLCQQQKRRLSTGDYPIDACLDLHAKRYHHAQTLLARFLSHQRHRNCVLIIHGKGNRNGQGSMIKSLVNAELKINPNVLAFHSAQAYDGGTGAVYVLLKSADRPK